MRWFISSSLFSDPRIILLLSLVIISIIIGIFLILTDKKVTRKKESIELNTYVKSKTEEVIKEINSKQSSVERLSVINDSFKKLLKEDFNLDETMGYSSLVDYFKEKKLTKYQEFCQKMFELYYSTNDVKYSDIEELKTKLVHLIDFSTRSKKIFDKKEIPQKIKKTLDSVSSKGQMTEELTPIMQAAEIEKQINELLKLKKYQLTKQQQALLKELEKKQFELNKHEKKNTVLLKETQRKIREQERLQKTLLKQGQKKKIIPKNNPKNKENLNQKNKIGYEDINIHPKKGKEYLKELKQKKKNK
ncbi:MAG: hypothetical protein WC260_02835 [Candidatus Pacearchaeota archaeon]